MFQNLQKNESIENWFLTQIETKNLSASNSNSNFFLPNRKTRLNRICIFFRPRFAKLPVAGFSVEWLVPIKVGNVKGSSAEHATPQILL